MGTKRKIKK